jgi:hypothetical protein
MSLFESAQLRNIKFLGAIRLHLIRPVGHMIHEIYIQVYKLLKLYKVVCKILPTNKTAVHLINTGNAHYGMQTPHYTCSCFNQRITWYTCITTCKPYLIVVFFSKVLKSHYIFRPIWILWLVKIVVLWKLLCRGPLSPCVACVLF